MRLHQIESGLYVRGGFQFSKNIELCMPCITIYTAEIAEGISTVDILHD